MNIQLRNLRSRSLPCILNIERDIYLASRIDFGLRKFQIAVLELRVAEAVTEGVERHSFEVEIGKSLRHIVFILRRDAVEAGIDRVW